MTIYYWRAPQHVIKILDFGEQVKISSIVPRKNDDNIILEDAMTYYKKIGFWGTEK